MRRPPGLLGAVRPGHRSRPAGHRTGLETYWRWYDRLWSYCWDYFIDHEHGAWYHTLTRDNRRLGEEKTPVGRLDYHTLGNCYEMLRVVTP